MVAPGLEHRPGIEQALDRDRLAPAHPHQDLALLEPGRIVHPHLEKKPVELRLGQRIGAFLLDRVLGGEHQERRWQRVGRAPDGDLALLHRLEQRRLHFRGSAVDLVGQNDVGEQGALLGMKLLGLLVEDHRPDDIGRQKIRRELDSGEGGVENLGQGPDREGLGQAGHALEQDVPPGQEPDQETLDHATLAHDPATDLVGHPAERLRFGDRLRDGRSLGHTASRPGAR